MRRTFQDLSAVTVPSGFNGRNKVLVQLWYLVRSLLFYPTPAAFNGWRIFLLRLFGAKIGNGVKIRSTSRVLYPWNLTIGAHTYIADDVNLYCLDAIKIGSHVSLSFGSVICTGTHDMEESNFPLQIAPVLIHDEAWIGAEAFVMPGLTIGQGAVIGVRSLVTRSVPGNEVWVGSPARMVRFRKSTSMSECEP